MDLTSPFPFRHQRTVHMPKPLEISVTPFQEQPISRDTNDNNNENDNETPSQSTPVPPSLRLDTSSYAMDLSQNENEFEQPSPDSGIQISSSFFRPRSPLPPTKLANIANALGVNTPMPAAYIRSPSPSTFRSPSRFLLHIVPPPFLPSDDDDDPTLSSSPPDGVNSISINSYRSQFRRGTLIPLYPTLRSQLGAIAREYSLPSTGGLVLYLSQVAPDGTNDGPRISDEVWKLLWYRALQAERQEQLGVASTSRAPSSLALRSASLPGNLTPSAPSPFPFDREYSSSLSSLSTTPTPTPVHHNSNPSDVPSDTDTSTSTATSTTSNPSPSTATTGFTSLDNESTLTRSHPNLLAIASDLTPNPFLPILAKVEFDIDLRKAKWYDGWLKARKERAKWKASTSHVNVNSHHTNIHDVSSSIERLVPLPLELPDLAKSRSRLDSLTSVSDEDRDKEKVHDAALKRIGYALLNDGENDGNHQEPNLANSTEKTATQNGDAIANANIDDGDEDEIDATVKMRIPLLESGPGSGGDRGGDRDIDPLADVFGTDAETWDALKHEAPLTRKNKKPRDLALVVDGDGVDDTDGGGGGGGDGNESADPIADDEGEVLKLWSDHQKPTLKLKNEGAVAPLAPRKPAPPPLKIAPPTMSATSISGSAGPRSAFPVMQRSFSETNLIGKDATSASDKRMKHHTGIVFGDGDGLGFGFGMRAGKFIEESIQEEEADRSSQIIMKQKLDVLEKQLAQLTPRKLSAASPPLPPLPLAAGLSPAEKLPGLSSPSSRREKDASAPASASTSPSPSPSTSPRKRLSVHKRGRSSMSSSSSSSRSHMEHQQLHQQQPVAATHALHVSKGSKGPITPPLNSVKPAFERTPPHLTLRPASGAAVSIASSNSPGHISSRSAVNSDKMNDGIGNGAKFASDIDDAQELIIVPPLRGSSSLHSAPNGAPSNRPIPDSPPLLPLSPDPFGKRDVNFGDTSRISDYDSYLNLPPLPPSVAAAAADRASDPIDPSQSTLHNIAMTLEMSPEQKQSSRFSADSEQSIDAAVYSSSNSSNNSLRQKRARSNSIMSVRGLRNLWRKSAATTTSGTGASAGSGSGPGSNPPSNGNASRSTAAGYGGADLPPLPAMPPLPPPPTASGSGSVDFGLPTPPTSGFTSASTSISGSSTAPSSSVSLHSREESLASVRSLQRPPASSSSSSSSHPQPPQPQLRPRRPSVSPLPRPDSGSDPFQFDSVLYKSPSTPTLLSSASNPAGGGGPSHKPNTSSVSSKGILKNWGASAGSAPADVELRKARIHQQQSALGLRRPSESRPESTASATSERSASDSRRSVPSPPPSPPKARRSTSQSRLLQLQFDLPSAGGAGAGNQRTSLGGSSGPGTTMSHSLPTGSVLNSASRFAEFAPLSSSLQQSTISSVLADESFEVIPSRRMTPSASYSGDVL